MFGWLFNFCKLRNEVYDKFTASRSCKAFKTFVTLVTFIWQVTCWHFWEMSVGYSGSSRFLPVFSQPWATLTVEACRSVFFYGLSEEWISSWKSQMTGKWEAGGRGISVRKQVLGAQGWPLRKLHGRELLESGRNRRAETLFLTLSQRQCPFWKVVFTFDSSPTCLPLICLLYPTISPSLGQNTPQKRVQVPPCSYALLLKSEPHTMLCFWINNSFSQRGYETHIWVLHGAVCMKLYHSSTVWILSSDYQLFEYSKWVLQTALIHQHSSLVSISSLSELAFIFLSLFKLTDMYA